MRAVLAPGRRSGQVPRMTNVVLLPGRAVLAVSGPDRVGFLQGLVSNDVQALVRGQAMWAALLTPQGKYQTDFLMVADGERILLDAPGSDAPDLATRLSRFRLRAAVTVETTSLAVHAGWGGPPPERPDAIVATDTRLPEAGWRLYAATALPENLAGEDDYDRHRLLLGLPDGARDLEPGRSVLLEAGFDELGGISWTKGCYLGQELTARTRYRGLLKRRLVPVAAENGLVLPEAGTMLRDRSGREAGTMRSSRDALGLAMLRLEHLRQPVEGDGGVVLRARVPAWMRLPAEAGTGGPE